MGKAFGLNRRFNQQTTYPMILEIDTSLSAGLQYDLVTVGGPGRISPSYTVDWGDGTVESFTTVGTKSHVYSAAGVYQIKISGSVYCIGSTASSPGNSANLKKLKRVLSWGRIVGLQQLSIGNSSSLIEVPDHLPSGLDSLLNMFNGCTTFNQNIGSWDVSKITSLSGMFRSNTVFNQNISGWNTSKVTNFSGMFDGATAFNQNISGWDVSSATILAFMFANNTIFNQNISGWNTSKVTTMSGMFNGATAFNQDLGSWALTNTVTLTNMLNNCGMSNENYSRTLIGWANYVSSTGTAKSRSLGATGRKYNSTSYGGSPYSTGSGARTYLTTATASGGGGWTISDGGAGA